MALRSRMRTGVQRFRRFPDAPGVKGLQRRQETRNLWEEDYQEWLRGPGRGVGTRPEYAVWRWLVQHGYTQGVDFTYQGSLMGGRQELGGAVADFIIENQQPRIIIRVQGEYFHYGDPAKEARNRIQKEQLAGMGFVVVDIKAADAMTRINEAMQMALRGMQLF